MPPNTRRRAAGAFQERLSPPVMERSRVQIATAYSPGTLFTFEGGRGICLSVPVTQPKTVVPTRAKMIFDGIEEHVQTWLRRIRTGLDANVDASLCVDQCFIRPGTVDQVQVDRLAGFELTEPSVVGYEPFPLVFQCPGCGLIAEREDVEALAKSPLATCACGVDNWRQVDVVFAHWSGEIEPLSPFRYWWNEQTGKVERLRSCSCGGTEFRLINKSPTFGEWRFVCVNCREAKELVQLSRFTATRMEPQKGTPGAWRDPIRLDENMLPVSYRASSLHYVQAGRFIAIDGTGSESWLELFLPGRQADLLRVVGEIHRFSMREPEWADIRSALLSAGRQDDLSALEGLQQGIAALEAVPAARLALLELKSKLQAKKSELVSAGAVPGPVVESARLRTKLAAQSEWSQKRNPFRATVEHQAFRREHIRDGLIARRTVDVLKPDRLVFQGADDPEEVAEYRAGVSELLRAMGVAECYLLRGLPVVEYTFGFTRVSATPIYGRPHGNGERGMPVRLCAFSKMPGGTKRPVYVLEQNNEALYVRLDEAVVRRWLQANAVKADAGDFNVGAAYLEEYEDFGEFLDEYKVRDAGSVTRTVANYTYALLHSLSHAFVHAVADYSGLDVDGIGEQVYGPDLAFVVYRKGMTPDLGNISATWRNGHRAFLESILSPRRLRCGSGSLCDNRGGACPACIMVPDIGCVAHNQLLSRSLIAGGRPPTWDVNATDLVVGLFETIRQAR